jgi:hypothetical protein
VLVLGFETYGNSFFSIRSNSCKLNQFSNFTEKKSSFILIFEGNLKVLEFSLLLYELVMNAQRIQCLSTQVLPEHMADRRKPLDLT